MENVVIVTSESDSDYSDESEHSDREEEIYESEHFMNHISKQDYEKNRNKLFTKDIEKIDIMVDSFSQSDKNDYIYKLFSQDSETGGHDSYKNVIGINLIKACITQKGGDEHFLDVCVPNIPYKACIHNSSGKHLMGRICMVKGDAKLNEHEPEIIKDNYFYPITLDEIEIKLYHMNTDGTAMSKYDSDRHNFYIFRLTILNNLELLK